MQLIDIEPKTEMINRAIQDGITTVEEYSVYLLGYTSGFNDCKDDVLKRCKGE